MPRPPEYQRVAADLREKIKSGEYPPGARLPSRAEMHEIYGCSNTVSDKAMMLLRAEGLVESTPGIGVFVCEQDS